jgi:hypothetical protein
MPFQVTDFMANLTSDLVQKKGVAESTAAIYIKSLYTLNGKAPFTNIAFLKNYEAIEERLKDYAPNSQKTMICAVVSVLSLFKDKPSYKKVYQHYYDKMMGVAKEMKEGTDQNEKTEVQKTNWIHWDEVQKVKDSLKEKVDAFKNNKHLTLEQFMNLLSYTILSLYTDVQPRRNQDYLSMSVIKKKRDMPTETNYLVCDGKVPLEFVFNKYKTAKTYGQQKIEIPESLRDVLALYLKHHPLNKGRVTEFAFLVHSDGTPLTAANAITRILNKIFSKKIGSSMLRHIYLSSKYNVDEMSKDAEAMGHSLEEQRKYLRKDDSSDAPDASKGVRGGNEIVPTINLPVFHTFETA